MAGGYRSNRRQHKPRGPCFLVLNPEYLLPYNILKKEYTTWMGMGQYHLAKDTERRMKALMDGNLAEYQKVSRSENLFIKTRRFQ